MMSAFVVNVRCILLRYNVGLLLG